MHTYIPTCDTAKATLMADRLLDGAKPKIESAFSPHLLSFGNSIKCSNSARC